MSTVRKQKSGDQLAVGDWLAPRELLDGAAEVLFACAWPAGADRSRDNDGTHVQLVVREHGQVDTYADVVSGSSLFDLASDEDLAELREKAERAQRIADIRAFAGWLEANPGVPVPQGINAQTSTNVTGDVWNSGAEGVAWARRMAKLMGAETSQDDEHIKAVKTFGNIAYTVVAWHRDGRPAEPISDDELDERLAAANRDMVAVLDQVVDTEGGLRRVKDPTGLAYTRADDGADDPTPVSGGRIEPHTGAVTDEGLVDETEAIAKHYDASNWRGEATEVADITCACGQAFADHGSVADAVEALRRHIDGGLADKTEGEAGR